MSNSTDNPDFIETLTDAFLEWFRNDILPVCSALFNVAVIITGVILNVLLLVTIRKRGLLHEPSSHFLLAFCIADFISYVLLLLPNVITASIGDWVLSQPFCQIHGAMLFLVVFANFGIVTVLTLERAIKLCRNDDTLYAKMFENAKMRNILIVAVFVVATLLAFIPVTGAGDIQYDRYHEGCRLDYVAGPAFLIVHFLLTIVLSLVAAVVSYSLIFHTRKNALIRNRLIKKNVETNKTNTSQRKLITSTVSEEPLDIIKEHDDEVLTPDTKPCSDPVSKPTAKKRRPRSTRRKQSLLFEVFSDDEENPAFHLAITYLALWLTIFVCYLPYIVVCFYGAFNNDSVWGGFYTISLLFLHVCFAAKPVVYLGHNRQYRELTKETIPEGMKTGAKSMRSSISSVSGKVEDFLFRSRANRRFTAALAAHKAVLIWKKRSTKKPDTIKLVDKISLTDAMHVPETGDGSNVVSLPVKTDTSYENNHRPTITPSDVNFNTGNSSFIEKERMRMVNGNFGEPQANTTVSPVPGMVQEL
ncbi:5-hydroxytryptamine receptor 1F-like [Mya arenaria]|nr:5-hydroxytryptamine receptor 1F-like [Mya arenaria]XP_052792150.1 5-hydroxytryptamine receptor 1F-like [Mya arenaria]